MKPSNNLRLLLSGLALLLCTGCATLQTSAFPIGDRIHPPKSSTSPVLLFRDALPERKYEQVARLNVHLEKTFFIPSAFPEALPRLEDLARQSGADALIQVEEKKSRLNETFIYNVTATAIRFTD